jgi:NAD(P)-dependent dehydrogenase (short-subunit alcohol dehydrogenase family)
MSSFGWTLGLEGRGVVLTGGVGDIGREVAKTFALAGARVAVVDRDVAECEEVVAGLPSPDRHLALGTDLREVGEHDQLFRNTETAFGRVDVLAHLAAVLRRRVTIDEVTEQDWDDQVDLNLKATFFLNRAAIRYFKERSVPGRIINFSSQGWWTGGYGGSIVYNATKGGIVSMTRGLARSVGPEGITVNAVAPGGVDTAMMRSGMTDAQLDAFTEMIPLGRLGTPAEMAGVVAFLASDHASFITGATINVSGGQLMY